MAYKLLFESDRTGTVLECFLNDKNEIAITIEDTEDIQSLQIISLDKSSAIKLSKVLRTEINKIK